MISKSGLLLINLGTPDSTSVDDVRRYLKQFLSDPRVIDISPLRRWLLLNLIILRIRPRKTAHAYSAIWTAEGSPLLMHTRHLAAKVQNIVGGEYHVEVAMRYGNPSIPDALTRLRKMDIDRIIVFPLYPQYASATTGSSVEEFFNEATKLWNMPFVRIVPPFYQDAGFINAFVEQADQTFSVNDVEKVIFSFHGLPERHVQKSDATYDSDKKTGEHCLQRDNCCEKIVSANRNCYRAQCFATARALGDALNVPLEKRVICFQSRLGRTPWIKPYTDIVLAELAAQGIKRIAVLSPAFVADCLETVEELGIRARADWHKAGGDVFHLVPCPNSSDAWANAVVALTRETCSGISQDTL